MQKSCIGSVILQLQYLFLRYRWLSYINPNYYGFSASVHLLLNGLQTDCTGSQLECFTSSGEYVLGQFSIEDVNPYLHILVRCDIH